MPCRVGITTNPAERRRYWESQHSTLRNWRILASGLKKSAAQRRENEEASQRGCRAAPGGAGSENDSWSVYYFEY